VLFQGKVYYISDNPKSVQIPPINVRYWLHYNPDIDWLDPPLVRGTNFLSSLPPDTIITPLGGAGANQEQHEAYLWSSSAEYNFQHNVGEMLPTLHYTLCKFLNRCSYDNDPTLHLVELFPPARWNEPAEMPEFITTSLACITPNPIRHIDSPHSYNQATIVRKALVGVGPECRGSWWCRALPEWGGGRKGVPPEYMQSYRQRMGDCIGFNANALAPVPPAERVEILVINRWYTSGRSIINIYDIMGALQGRYSSFADISLEYMEGKGFKEQARMWNAASIIIHVHGATMGNWPFMSQKAVVVHIAPRPGGLAHDNMYAQKMIGDFEPVNGITYVAANNKESAYVHLKAETIWKQPQWQELTAEEKIKIIEEGTCLHLQTEELKQHCEMWWLHKNISLMLNPEMIIEATDTAVKDLFTKQGKPIPVELEGGKKKKMKRGRSSRRRLHTQTQQQQHGEDDITQQFEKIQLD
jgi:hypothetical protein